MLKDLKLEEWTRENPVWFSEEVLKSSLWEKEKEILLSKELFVEPYFSTVYQNSYFIVIRPNYGN